MRAVYAATRRDSAWGRLLLRYGVALDKKYQLKLRNCSKYHFILNFKPRALLETGWSRVYPQSKYAARIFLFFRPAMQHRIVPRFIYRNVTSFSCQMTYCTKKDPFSKSEGKIFKRTHWKLIDGKVVTTKRLEINNGTVEQPSILIILTWIVSIDFHRLIEAIDNNRLIIIDYIDYIDCFPMIDFHRLGTPGEIERNTRRFIINSHRIYTFAGNTHK